MIKVSHIDAKVVKSFLSYDIYFCHRGTLATLTVVVPCFKQCVQCNLLGQGKVGKHFKPLMFFWGGEGVLFNSASCKKERKRVKIILKLPFAVITFQSIFLADL